MTSVSIASRVGDFLAPYAEVVNPAIESALTDENVPAALGEAMRYACLDGGKRLRPALVMLAAETVAEKKQWLADPLGAAVAVELIHCYSLVHDDLPAMDDDTLRRGRETCHVKFGEAMAILVGDSLLTRAFEIISDSFPNAEIGLKLIAALSAAAGPEGMVAGQVADMELCEVPPGDAGRRYIHLRKTAAMLRASARMGGICAGASETQLDSLGQFGEKTGLAFQVADDLLDATGSAKTIGKTPGKDARAGKRTYAGEIGIEQTRQLVTDLANQATDALEIFGPRAEKLRELTHLLAQRDR